MSRIRLTLAGLALLLVAGTLAAAVSPGQLFVPTAHASPNSTPLCTDALAANRAGQLVFTNRADGSGIDVVNTSNCTFPVHLQNYTIAGVIENQQLFAQRNDFIRPGQNSFDVPRAVEGCIWGQQDIFAGHYGDQPIGTRAQPALQAVNWPQSGLFGYVYGGPCANNARCEFDAPLPSVLAPGQQFTVRFKLTNPTGATWYRAPVDAPFGYKLMSGETSETDPQRRIDNGTWNVVARDLDHRIALPQNAIGGQQILVNETFTAPQTPGTYAFVWTVGQEGHMRISEEGGGKCKATVTVAGQTASSAVSSVASSSARSSFASSSSNSSSSSSSLVALCTDALAANRAGQLVFTNRADGSGIDVVNTSNCTFPVHLQNYTIAGVIENQQLFAQRNDFIRPGQNSFDVPRAVEGCIWGQQDIFAGHYGDQPIGTRAQPALQAVNWPQSGLFGYVYGGPCANNARCEFDAPLPSVLAPGQQFTVRFKLTNPTGATWYRAPVDAPFGYKLMSGETSETDPQRRIDNGTWNVVARDLDHRIALPQNAIGGQQILVNETFTAPQTPGTYAFVWTVGQEGHMRISEEGGGKCKATVTVAGQTASSAVSSVASSSARSSFASSSSNSSSSSSSSVAVQCNDGLDNDGDGAADMNDFSCSNTTDNDETNPKSQCQDGIDNDQDGLIDFPNDGGCVNRQDNDETGGNLGCVEVRKVTQDTNGNNISPVAQFTFNLDNSRTAVNDGSGLARFDGVTAGSHVITENIPSGWTQVSVVPSGGLVNVQNGASCAQVTITNKQVVTGGASFLVTKSDARSTAAVGETLTYTISVTNVSGQTANSVTVIDTLPSSLTYLSSNEGGQANGQTVTWNLGALPTGQSKTLRVEARVKDVADGTIIRNSAQVQGGGTTVFGEDVTIVQGGGENLDISVEIEDDRDPVAPGEEIEYTITVENDGEEDADNLQVTMILDDALIDCDPDQGGDESGGVVEWEIDLDEGDEETLTVVCEVDEDEVDDGDEIEVVVIAGDDSVEERTDIDDDGSNDNDDDEDDDDNDSEDGLTITKDAVQTEVFPGGTVEYAVTVMNEGDTTIKNIVIEDQFQGFGVTIVDDGGGDRMGSNGLKWEIAELKANKSKTFRYRLLVDGSAYAGQTISNNVNVEADGDDGDSASAVVSVISVLPQTGGGRKVKGQDVRFTSSSRAQGGSTPIIPLISVIVSGLSVGAWVARKVI